MRARLRLRVKSRHDRIKSHDPRLLRESRSRREEVQLLPRRMTVGLHPFCPQHRRGRADPRSRRRDARQRRPPRRAGLHRPGRRARAAHPPAAGPQLSRRRRTRRALAAGSRGAASAPSGCWRGCTPSTSSATASRPIACRCSTCRSRGRATSSARAPMARSPRVVAAHGPRRRRGPDRRRACCRS